MKATQGDAPARAGAGRRGWLPQRIFALLLLLAAGGSLPAEELALVPGVRAGKVRMGAPRQEVVSLLGTPLSSRTGQEGRGVARDVWEEPGYGYLFAYYRDGATVQVMVASPAYVGPAGLRVGGELAAARAAYPRGEVQSLPSDEGGAPIFWLDAVEEGIAFQSLEFEGYARGAIHTIAVHLPGARVITF